MGCFATPTAIRQLVLSNKVTKLFFYTNLRGIIIWIFNFSEQTSHYQYNYRQQKHQDRNFVDTVHHLEVEVGLAVGVGFAEKIREHFTNR